MKKDFYKVLQPCLTLTNNKGVSIFVSYMSKVFCFFILFLFSSLHTESLQICSSLLFNETKSVKTSSGLSVAFLEADEVADNRWQVIKNGKVLLTSKNEAYAYKQVMKYHTDIKYVEVTRDMSELGTYIPKKEDWKGVDAPYIIFTSWPTHSRFWYVVGVKRGKNIEKIYDNDDLPVVLQTIVKDFLENN